MAEIIKLPNIAISEDQTNQIESVQIMNKTANEITVNDQQEYEFAADLLGDISNRIRQLDEIRKKLKAPILEAGRNIDNLFKIPIELGNTAKKLTQGKMLDYVAKVELERQEAELKLAREAEKLKKEAEAEALALIANGEDEAAQEILDNVDVMPTPSNVIEKPKASGVSTRSNWKCKVIDMEKLLKAILDKRAPISLIQINTVSANKYAKAVRNTLSIPGLEFYNDPNIAVRKS